MPVVPYKKLLAIASLDEKLALCPDDMRSVLSAINTEAYEISPAVLDAVVNDAMNIRKAVCTKSGVNTILTLLSRFDEGAALAQLALILGAQHDTQAIALSALDTPEKLLGFLKFSDEDYVVQEKPHGQQTIEVDYGLRHYQREPVKEIIHRMAKEKRLLFHAPTGAGKTRTMMSVVSMHFRLHGPTMVLWLASTSELVSQAADAFKEAWKAHGDIETRLVEWRGGNDVPDFDITRAPNRNTMLTASLQFLTLLTKRENPVLEKLQRNISLIVFDEAHQSIAPTYKGLVEGIMSHSDCRLLGITATPGRSVGKEETKALSEMYAKQKVNIAHPGHDDPISYLVAERYLAHPHFERHTFEYSGIKPNETGGDKDYSREVLNKLGIDIQRNMKILDIVNTIVENDHTRIIVFTPSVNAARFCAIMLKHQYGIQDSMVVTGETPRSERRNIIERFKGTAPYPHVIFNYNVLTTGFDAPKTSAVVIARPTKSSVLYSQMVGRALRGPKSNGNDKAYIHTLVDKSFDSFGRIEETFSSWDSLWKADSL